MLKLRKLFDWEWRLSGDSFAVYVNDIDSTIFVGVEIKNICHFREDLAETYPMAVICELSTIEVVPLDRAIYVYDNYTTIDYRVGEYSQSIARILCDTLKYLRDWIRKELEE